MINARATSNSGPAAGRHNRACIMDTLRVYKAAGRSYPVKTIAIDVGLHSTQVGRHLTILEREGHVSIIRKRGMVLAEVKE